MKAERLCQEHISQVAQLERLCFAQPWSEKALQLLVGAEAAGVVCLHEGAVIAYGSILWAPGEGQILNLAVRPDHRRRGYGKAVLEGLIKLAEQRECEVLTLEVRASNQAAVTLYERFGFTVAGVRKHFYQNPTEDAYVMNLTRNQPAL